MWFGLILDHCWDLVAVAGTRGVGVPWSRGAEYGGAERCCLDFRPYVRW